VEQLLVQVQVHSAEGALLKPGRVGIVGRVAGIVGIRLGADLDHSDDNTLGEIGVGLGPGVGVTAEVGRQLLGPGHLGVDDGCLLRVRLGSGDNLRSNNSERSGRIGGANKSLGGERECLLGLIP
jgi:hypothetical protein